MNTANQNTLRAADAALVAAIDLAVGERTADVRQMSVTRQTLEGLVSELGKVPLVSFGAAYPIYRWVIGRNEIAVIDRGSDRVRVLMSDPGWLQLVA